jgi:phospholipid-transporting ATPase
LPQTWDYSLANDVGLAAPGSSSIECEQPNNSLYTFTGNLQLGQQKLPLTTNQVRRLSSVHRADNLSYK